MKGGILEFDKTVRDFQASLTLLNDDSFMQESIDNLWRKYRDSYTGRVKLFLCLLSHSSIGNHFRDLPYYRSVSYLVRKEIPISAIIKYFSFPWDHQDLGSIFLHLPHQVTWEYLQLILSEPPNYVHPILFRILRKSLVVKCEENEFILAATKVLLYESNEFVHDLFPSIENDENEGINENPSQLYWPLDEVDRPETDDSILKHYAHCIVNSSCPDNIKSKIDPIAKEYKKYNTMSLEDLLSSSGESEWTVLWERVVVDENISSLEIKYMLREVFLLMALPEKILFLHTFFHDFDTDTKLLKSDGFDDQVKTFMNKAGDYDFITAQHDACYLALSSPKEFLNILLKEVLKGGHKVYLKILLESLQLLLFHDPLVIKDKLINDLLKCPEEKVPDILITIGLIVECNYLDHFGINLVNTAHNLFTKNKLEGTCRLISGLKSITKFIDFDSNSELLETLFNIFKAISDRNSLSSITSRIQDEILCIIKDRRIPSEERQPFIEITNNELHKLLRNSYFSNLKDDSIDFDKSGRLVEFIVSVLPMMLPSEFQIMFHQINFQEDKFFTCLLIFFVQNGFSYLRTWNELKEKIVVQHRETLKLMVPSFLYATQNNLLFFALANLDATLFQKRLFISHWISLILLMVGVVLVQLSYHKSDSNFNHSQNNTLILFSGFYVIAACFSSSYSGIYFEKLVKTTNDNNSLIIRNLQMGIFSIVFSGSMALRSKSLNIFRFGNSFNSLVALIILVQCFGGLLVSVVIKYADNILKGFATSISIIVSCACSYFMLGDLIVDLKFFFGTFLVLIATFLYGMADTFNKIGLLGMLIKCKIIKKTIIMCYWCDLN
ncbi:SLC35A1_2_3 [Lepeophtheirus salmonis]|uniref:SLC35A1_2_3 n=1 Tax=Lepeophtheirus salmonis TaxID=72036 RepID=A0A7R8H3F6_LEPSM|nr:SLC35A1_2_3 [Lepeophtheirus salmonis]CAF2829168.1 SLC35A1_2_3 [Lepeophtheirus salmonis]